MVDVLVVGAGPVGLCAALWAKRLGLSHCTGLQAGAYLAREFGDAVAFCNVGYTLTLS